MVYIIAGTACSKTLHGLKGWQQLSVIKQADFPPPASTPLPIMGVHVAKLLLGGQTKALLSTSYNFSCRQQSLEGTPVWNQREEQFGVQRVAEEEIHALARPRPHCALGLVYSHQEAGWVPVFQSLCPTAQKGGGGHIPVCSTDPSKFKKLLFLNPGVPPHIKTRGPLYFLLRCVMMGTLSKCTKVRSIFFPRNLHVVSLHEFLFLLNT